MAKHWDSFLSYCILTLLKIAQASQHNTTSTGKEVRVANVKSCRIVVIKMVENKPGKHGQEECSWYYYNSNCMDLPEKLLSKWEEDGWPSKTVDGTK